jgi:septation ring formation regulator EzrA
MELTEIPHTATPQEQTMMEGLAASLDYLQSLDDSLKEIQTQLTTINDQQEDIINKLDNISLGGTGFQIEDTL